MTIISAPLSGQLISLDDVPDPVFSQRIVGDGFSIDPTSQCLVAPVDGRIAQLHRAAHALTIATDDGVDVLMHIGIDTVALAGTGFRPLVHEGARVRVGDPLIEFDADYIATHATSLLTQVIVTARRGAIRLDIDSPRFVTGGDAVVRVHREDAASLPNDATISGGARAMSQPIHIRNPTGLHARPAAVIAAVARRFAADSHLHVREREANAKSVVAIMSAEIEQGDDVVVVAAGTDAQAACEAIAEALADGLGEPAGLPAVPSVVPGAASTRARTEPVSANVLIGVAAASGVAVGRIARLRTPDVVISERSGTPAKERNRLQTAIHEAKQELQQLRARLRGEADYGHAAIFGAHEEILADPDLVDAAIRSIDAGQSAAFAWRDAFTSHAGRLSAVRNELLAARANDVRDAGRRVLNRILGRSDTFELPADAIVIADDLAPSDVAGFDRSRVLGFCTTAGGVSSHAAILARSLELPAIVAIDPRALEIADGTEAIVDGDRGVLTLTPSAAAIAQIRQRKAARTERQRRALADAHQPAVTRDGRRIEVAANAAEVAEASRAASAGADGIGLLRTELLFMDRVTVPTEDEQFEAYAAIVRAIGSSRSTIVRTLDVGGDKPLPFLPLAHEQNPFLGIRGLRIGLQNRELLRTQLRAIVRASTIGPVQIMFPMIAKVDELHAARTILDEARAAFGAAPVPVGIMIEVPSAALIAPQLARDVDFFSIGTNDLTQYTLAMDRGHPKLAAGVDALHPAVLRLIDLTVRAAHDAGKWVGVCGGVAADEQAIPILAGLDVDELSVAVPAVADVKARIRGLTMEECRRLARRALEAASERDVRALVPREPE